MACAQALGEVWPEPGLHRRARRVLEAEGRLHLYTSLQPVQHPQRGELTFEPAWEAPPPELGPTMPNSNSSGLGESPAPSRVEAAGGAVIVVSRETLAQQN